MHVSIHPAPPGLSEHYSAPVLQWQPLYHAVMQSTKVTCSQDSHVRGWEHQETLWCLACTGQKNAGMCGEKHLARVQARIRAAGDHLVEITFVSGAPWWREVEREGRALTSAVQHTRPSIRKMVTAGCTGRSGRQPVARAWPWRHLASAAAAGGGLLQCNSDHDKRTGTFFGCVRLVNKLQSLQGCSAAPFGCPCAPPNDFSIRTPHFASCSPQWASPILDVIWEKLVWGVTPLHNWEFGKGDPLTKIWCGDRQTRR